MKSVLIPMLFVGAVCTVAWAFPVHAVGHPADAPITEEEARTLKNALDTLEITLNQLESRLASTGGAAERAVADPPQARDSLGEIRGTLVAIDGTLTSRELAFLMRQRALAAGEATGTGISSAEDMGLAPGAVAGTATDGETGGGAAASSETTPLLRRKVVQWGVPGVLALGILGMIGYFLWRKEKEKPIPLSSPPPFSPPSPSASSHQSPPPPPISSGM